MSKDVLIRDLDEETVEKLKEKASLNKRSLQAELKEVLQDYAGRYDIEKVRAMARESIKKYKAEGKKFSDSTKDIREDRERR